MPTPYSNDSEPAGLGARLGAALLDALITGLPAAGLTAALVAGMRWLWPQVGIHSLVMALVGLVIFLGMYLLIHGRLLAREGQTQGKRILGLCILRADGNAASLSEAFYKRTLPVMILGVIPVLGGLLVLVDLLFIFRKDRRCAHDLLAGTIVVKLPRTGQEPLVVQEAREAEVPEHQPPAVKAVTAPVAPVRKEIPPPPPPPAAPPEPRGLAIPEHLELCPYCAELTSADTLYCRGCGRNPFAVDSANANLSLKIEELQKKARKLYEHRLDRDALEVLRFATRAYPHHRESWNGILQSPNADPALKAEAQQKLDHLIKTIYS